MRPTLILLACLVLGGCGGRPDDDTQLNALDNELASMNDGNPARDPQLREALAGQIMVDPGLTQTSNANALRPPNRPPSDQLPSTPPPADPVDARTLKSAPQRLATARNAAPRPVPIRWRPRRGSRPPMPRACRACATPPDGPSACPSPCPYPGAQVAEAAGNDANGCALRIVSLRTAASPAKVIDYYYTKASGAGLSAEHKMDGTQHVLGGTGGNGAYIVYATPRDGGTDIDLVVRGG
ncbi:hypothetical protein P0F65_01320 [Sphingomonas sp. I4]